MDLVKNTWLKIPALKVGDINRIKNDVLIAMYSSHEKVFGALAVVVY
ncbi:MAG: hypothetical protein ACRBBZ_04485 [Nitrosopumilus sp.]